MTVVNYSQHLAAAIAMDKLVSVSKDSEGRVTDSGVLAALEAYELIDHTVFNRHDDIPSLEGIFDSIKNTAMYVVKFILDTFMKIFGFINSIIQRVRGFIVGSAKNVKDLPAFNILYTQSDEDIQRVLFETYVLEKYYPHFKEGKIIRFQRDEKTLPFTNPEEVYKLMNILNHVMTNQHINVMLAREDLFFATDKAKATGEISPEIHASEIQSIAAMTSEVVRIIEEVTNKETIHIGDQEIKIVFDSESTRFVISEKPISPKVLDSAVTSITRDQLVFAMKYANKSMVQLSSDMSIIEKNMKRMSRYEEDFKRVAKNLPKPAIIYYGHLVAIVASVIAAINMLMLRGIESLRFAHDFIIDVTNKLSEPYSVKDGVKKSMKGAMV